MKKYLYLFTFLLVATAVWGTTQSVFAVAPTGFMSQAYSDGDGDGAVDTLVVSINGGEALTICTVSPAEIASDWTYSGNDIGGTLSSATCNTGTGKITFTITGASANTTGASSVPTIAYNNTDVDNSIANGSGILGAVVATTIDDNADPIIADSSDYRDADADGKIDRFTLTFSENVVANSVLANNDLLVVDAGDFTGIAFGSSSTDLITGTVADVIITLGTEATVIDTYEGSGNLEIASQNAFSLEDAAGNINNVLGSQSQLVFTDYAFPRIKDFAYGDANDDGKLDQFIIFFSEPLSAATFLSPNDLLLTNVGDFTGAAFGAGATDAVTGVQTFATISLGTAATAVDTHEDSGNLAISTQNAFSLEAVSGGTVTSTLGAQAQATITDDIAPVVVSTTPVDGDTGVAVDAPVVLTFSESMDTTPSFTTFATSPVVTHAVTWSSNDTVATFDHTVDYANSTAISATLSDARDDSGNAIAGSTFVDFTTAAPSTNSGGHSVSSVRNIVYGFNAPVVVPTNTLRTALAAMTGLLKMGMNNDWVKTLQTFINTYATPTPLLVVDGAFGPKTDAAVKSFQVAQGIKIDGIVGPQTRTEMIAEIK